MLRVKLDLDTTDRITFDREVAIPTPDGKPLKIGFAFKYRDRQAMAELYDAHLAQAHRAVAAEAAARKAAAEEGRTLGFADTVPEAVARDVAAICDVAADWYVDGEPFGEAALTRLCNKYPGAAVAIVSDYRVSCAEGRLGN